VDTNGRINAKVIHPVCSYPVTTASLTEQKYPNGISRANIGFSGIKVMRNKLLKNPCLFFGLVITLALGSRWWSSVVVEGGSVVVPFRAPRQPYPSAPRSYAPPGGYYPRLVPWWIWFPCSSLLWHRWRFYGLFTPDFMAIANFLFPKSSCRAN